MAKLTKKEEKLIEQAMAPLIAEYKRAMMDAVFDLCAVEGKDMLANAEPLTEALNRGGFTYADELMKMRGDWGKVKHSEFLEMAKLAGAKAYIEVFG